MAVDALIDTFCLTSFVFLGLWIVAHVVQMVRLLFMTHAYEHHNKRVFAIPFFPLLTRLLHEMAVAQFLASEALQRGELPPTALERYGAGGAGRKAPVPLEDVHPSIAPSLAMWTTPPTSATSGTPLSSSTMTNNTDAIKQHPTTKKASQKRRKGNGDDSLRHAAAAAAEALDESAVGTEMQPLGTRTSSGAAYHTDDAVRVAVNSRAGDGAVASAAAVSWWTPQLDGQCLVMGLQLPLELLPTELSTPISAASANATAVTGASEAALPGRDGHRRSKAGGVGGGAANSAAANSAGSGAAGIQQPTVNLQLKHYQLTPASLTASTAAAVVAAAKAGERTNASSSSALQFVATDSQTQVVVAHQLAALPVHVRTRTELRRHWPTTTSSSRRASLQAYNEVTPLWRRRESPVSPYLLRRQRQLDFDAFRYTYTHHYQRLLETAVAEQTAIAHRAQHNRKSVKRAQRIAAMLADYLEYAHVDDEGDDDGNGSLAEEGTPTDAAAEVDEPRGGLLLGDGAAGSGEKRSSVTGMIAAPFGGDSSSSSTGAGLAASRQNQGAVAAAGGTSKRNGARAKGGSGALTTRAAAHTRAPWLPLLADSYPSMRLDDLHAAAKRDALEHGNGSGSPRRGSARSRSAREQRQQQSTQLAATTASLTDSMLMQCQQQSLLRSQNSTLRTASSTSASVDSGVGVAAVTSANLGGSTSFAARPRESRKSSRSKEQRRRCRAADAAASSVSNAAVVALEALVEQVRLAQALRPRYRSLQCTVHFMAERHLVRRGASEPPTWTALQAVTRPTTTSASSLSSSPPHKAAPVKIKALTAASSVHGVRRQNLSLLSDERESSGYGGGGGGWPLRMSSHPSASALAVARHSSDNVRRHHHRHYTANQRGGSNSNESTTTATGGGEGTLTGEGSMPAFASGDGNSILVAVPDIAKEPSSPGHGLRGSRSQVPAPSHATGEVTLAAQASNSFTETALPDDRLSTSTHSRNLTSSFYLTPKGSRSDWGVACSDDPPREPEQKVPPPLRMPEFAAMTIPVLLTAVAGSGSTSANNAALEFLRASRLRENNKLLALTAGLAAGSTSVASNNDSVRSSASPARRVGSSLSDGDDGACSATIPVLAAMHGPLQDSLTASAGAAWQPSPSETSRSAAPVAPTDVILTVSTPNSQATVAQDGEQPSAPAAGRRKGARHLAPIHVPRDNAGDTAAAVSAPAVSADAPPQASIKSATSEPSLPPRAHDLRLVYVIGADRSALLRALTLDATRSFGAGAQNYLCFFTARDERRARRRHMQRIDRQNRTERLLLERLKAVQATAAAEAEEQEDEATEEARRRGAMRGRSGHDTATDERSRNTHDGERELSGAATPLRTASADRESTEERRAGPHRSPSRAPNSHGTETSVTSLLGFVTGGGRVVGGVGVARELVSPVDTNADVDYPLGGHQVASRRPADSSFHSMPSLPAASVESPTQRSLELSLHSAQEMTSPTLSENDSLRPSGSASSPPLPAARHAAPSDSATEPGSPDGTGVLSSPADRATVPLLTTTPPSSLPSSPHAGTAVRSGGRSTVPCSGRSEGAAGGADWDVEADVFGNGGDDEGGSEEHRSFSLAAPHATAEGPVEQQQQEQEQKPVMVAEDARERRESLSSSGALAATLCSMPSLVFSKPHVTHVASPPMASALSLPATSRDAPAAALVEATVIANVLPTDSTPAPSEQATPDAAVEASATADNGNVLPLPSASLPATDAAATAKTEAEAEAGKVKDVKAAKKGRKTKSKKNAAATELVAAAAAPAEAPALPPLAPVRPPAVPLVDAVDAADVRTYFAAVGVTLPEQIFLVRHAGAPTVLQQLVRALNKTSHGSSADVSGSGGGASSGAAAVPPGVLLHAAYPNATVLAAAATAALTSGAARVLEGQVEVAELSVDVLCRQIAPFVPRGPPPMSSSDEEEDDFHDDNRDLNDASSTYSDVSDEDDDEDDDEDEDGDGAGEDAVVFHEVEEARLEDRQSRRTQSDRTPHQQNRWSSSRTVANRKKHKSRPSGTHHAAVPPAAATFSERSSRRHGGHSGRHASSRSPHQHRSYRVSDERRRRRHERRLARHVARWQRRVMREQAAAAKANYVPVAVGALFFSIPPTLPVELMHQQRHRWTEQLRRGERARLLVPDWTLGVSEDGHAASQRSRSARAEEASTALATHLPETLDPSSTPSAASASGCTVCVTLIYTTTAEQLARTLGRAAETAKKAAQRRAEAAAAAAIASSTTAFLSSAAGWYLNPSTATATATATPQRRHAREVSFSSGFDFLGAALSNGDSGVYSPPSLNSRSYQSVATLMGNSYLSRQAATTAPPSCESSLRCSFWSENLTSPPSPKLHSSRHLHSSLSGFSPSSPTRDFPAPYHSTTELPASLAGRTMSPPHSCAGTATFSEDDASRDSMDDERAGQRPGCRRAHDSENVGTSDELPPSLLLLTDSADSVRELDEIEDAARGGAGQALMAPSLFADPYERRGGDVVDVDSPLGSPDRRDDGSGRTSARTVRFHADVEEDKLSAADELMNVLRDATCFPEGVPVGLTLAYVRIGNDLYAVTEVVDRTFLQYREERVLQTHGTRRGSTSSKINKNEDDAAAEAALRCPSFSDSGEDDASSTSSESDPSTVSGTSVHTLDAALAAIQNQHKATARQERRRLHRRRAVSTSDFGEISYSLSSSAPVRPGMRRQEVHMCWRCLSAEATIIFVPCGHYAACEACAELLANCCVCRKPILSTVSLLDRGRGAQPQQHQPQQQQQKQSPKAASSHRHRESR